MHFSVAAGNGDKEVCMASPVRMSKGSDAATVGNINVEDRCGPTSNFGPCVTLGGPGENITSTWIGSSSATGVLPGTYMAFQHIAGLMVVLFVHDPSLRFDTTAMKKEPVGISQTMAPDNDGSNAGSIGIIANNEVLS